MAEPSPGRPPSSQASNEQGIEEADALLTGQNTGKDSSISHNIGRSKWREIGLFVWALIATAAVVVLAVIYQHSQAESRAGEGCIGKGCEGQKLTGKRNLIMMVSDGMGPTSLSLTRSWINHTYNTPYDQALVLDDHLIGQSRTRSTSSLVTDSAAGATAFSCGLKSYNGAISVTPDNFLPCGSVMEAAKKKGYTTGLVVTTRITDATPAVFVSHARRREMEEFIARQMIGEIHPLGRMVDLMFGGGRCKFLPNSTDRGCRTDGKDVVEIAKKEGWRYVDNKEDFGKLGESPKLPLMGLFAHEDIPYEIDRQHQTDRYPSLEEMTKTALRTLAAATKDTEAGFFVMIEGSRIDHAGHANDPAAQVHEVLAYDRAMAAVLDFIKNEETPTLMVATSDHETGGLATARQLHREYPPYVWYPGVLANASHSASYVAHEYHKHLRESSTTPDSKSEKLREYLTSLSSRTLGVHDCASDEIDTLITDPMIAA
jgi:alkaline phosphatase